MFKIDIAAILFPYEDNSIVPNPNSPLKSICKTQWKHITCRSGDIINSPNNIIQPPHSIVPSRTPFFS